MTQSKVIGITGGVGAGKSTVLLYIREHYDTEIILADEVGRALMEPGCSVYEALKAYYGDSILSEDGRIDRAALAAVGLQDQESQAILNRIEHPLIHKEILKLIRNSGKNLVFLEAALLKEGGLTGICDEIWTVDAGLCTRIERLMESRGYTEEKCRMIIERQLSETDFRELADVVIRNDGPLEEVFRVIDQEMNRIGAVKHEISESSERE